MSAERAAFMPMGDSSDFLPKKSEKGSASGSNKRKTVRISLDLFEPDEIKFPEFNYVKVVQIEKRKQKILSKLPTNGNDNNHNKDDPFANDDNDDAERLSRELEAKYGAGSAYSKSTRAAIVDRGAGYDISDSFLDDTEAYDELIPDEVETHRGGFYINSGALEFKKLSNFERPGDELIMPKAKKRALSTTSESDSENEGKSPNSKTKKKSKIEEKIQPKTTATSSSDEQGKAKKAKKEKSEKSKDVVKEEKKKEPEKAIKTTTVKDMLRAKRDNMLKEQGKTSGGGTTTTTDNDDEDGTESTSSLAVSESSRDSHQETAAPSGTNEVKLPENLPESLYQLILSLQQHVVNSTKGNSLDEKGLDKLVLIDKELKAINANVRVQTFFYLEKHLSCSRKSLFEKVKHHRISATTKRMANEVDKLRKILAETFPHQLEKYEKEKANYEAKKTNGETVHEPKKKYHWNDASRHVLSDIVQKIEDLYKELKTKKYSNSREFLEIKMKEKVLPLWPEGWIKQKDIDNELEKKKKKEAKAASILANNQLPKQNTSSNNTNGKSQTQKTENSQEQGEVKQLPISNGKAQTPSPAPSISPTLQQNASATAAATSVIKRSSDHSISSIIASSTSPTPPLKMSDIPKPKLIELDKLTNPSDLLKVTLMQQEKLNRSDSTDSDCVEIVESFEQSKLQKSLPNHNNNRVPRTPSPLLTCPQKKIKIDPTEAVDEKIDKSAYKTDKSDYSLILAGLQSLTNSSSKSSNNYLSKDSVSSNHRKSETSSHVKSESNGTNDHFVDPSYSLQKSQNNNVNYSIGDLIALNRATFNTGNVVQGKIKSSDQKSSHFYNHQQQLNSSTNNNLHSISLSLTPPQSQSASSTSNNSNHTFSMPSILNLSHRKQ